MGMTRRHDAAAEKGAVSGARARALPRQAARGPAICPGCGCREAPARGMQRHYTGCPRGGTPSHPYLQAVRDVLALVSSPGEKPVGLPGSMTRRAWELGAELAQKRAEVRALRELAGLPVEEPKRREGM